MLSSFYILSFDVILLIVIWTCRKLEKSVKNNVILQNR